MIRRMHPDRVVVKGPGLSWPGVLHAARVGTRRGQRTAFVPPAADDERLRHGTLIFASVLITLISLIWVVTYLAYGYPMSAGIPAVYQLITVVGLVVLTRTRRFGVLRTTQLLACLVLPALLQASLGGFVASSAMTLWAVFTPLAALALLGLRRSVCGSWRVKFFTARASGATMKQAVAAGLEAAVGDAPGKVELLQGGIRRVHCIE